VLSRQAGFEGSRVARVISVVPFVRTSWVVEQSWKAPTASVGGE